MDSRFNFESVIAVKIVVCKQQRVLLVREPESNEWMPGRLGLPGGKILLNESIDEALERKITTEVGLNIEVRGIYKLVNILMPHINVYQLIYVADYVSGEIDTTQTESTDISWYSKDQIENLSVDDFTEYFNRELLLEVLNFQLQTAPKDLVKSQDNRSEEIKRWMEKGVKS